MEAPNPERERIFDAFRHWGYLEADLDPLGLFRPQPQTELQIENDYAREARHFYCGTIGVEFMHITEAERRRCHHEDGSDPPRHRLPPGGRCGPELDGPMRQRS